MASYASPGPRSFLPSFDISVALPYHSVARACLEEVTHTGLIAAGIPASMLPGPRRADGVLVLRPSVVLSEMAVAPPPAPIGFTNFGLEPISQ